ncbi:MAG: hypothetical protein IT372_29820 [Polyangiaceae bacterium]|nr:hypothetical protein [Polyangiaceae bacterium]
MKYADRRHIVHVSLAALLAPLLAGALGCINMDGGQGGAGGAQTGAGGAQTGAGGAQTGAGGATLGEGGATLGEGGGSSCDNSGTCGGYGTWTSACLGCDEVGCLGCALANSCADDLAACQNEQQCLDLVDCFVLCEDSECAHLCIQQFPQGWPLYDVLTQCMYCQCPVDCYNPDWDWGCQG